MEYKIHLQILQGTFYNRHLTIEIIVKAKIMEFFFFLNQARSSIYNNIPVNDLTYYIVLLYANKLNIVSFQKCFPRLLYQLLLLKSSDSPVDGLFKFKVYC